MKARQSIFILRTCIKKSKKTNKPQLPPEYLSRIINTINVTYTPHVMHAKINIRLGSVLYYGMNY